MMPTDRSTKWVAPWHGSPWKLDPGKLLPPPSVLAKLARAKFPEVWCNLKEVIFSLSFSCIRALVGHFYPPFTGVVFFFKNCLMGAGYKNIPRFTWNFIGPRGGGTPLKIYPGWESGNDQKNDSYPVCQMPRRKEYGFVVPLSNPRCCAHRHRAPWLLLGYWLHFDISTDPLVLLCVQHPFFQLGHLPPPLESFPLHFHG